MKPAEAADRLILVDEHDREIGECSKLDCHLGDGRLHRAFSVFLFNPRGELLLQQRSAEKMLWGGYWSNSCCSHPRVGEETLDAAHRRLREELGVAADLRFLYKFTYQANFGDVGAEHEHCSVYAGHFDGELDIDREEISDWRFVSPAGLDAELERAPDTFTPWFRLEWKRIRAEYLDELL